MSRRMLVGIEMAMVVAEKQGCDVLSATGAAGDPEAGTRDATVVLLRKQKATRVEYRVTTHYETETEFGSGSYYDELGDATIDYLERARKVLMLQG